MIDCAKFRRALLADPGDPDPELRAHREACPECARFAQGLARFEAKLERAMRVRAGEASRAVPARAPRRRFRRPPVRRPATGSRSPRASRWASSPPRHCGWPCRGRRSPKMSSRTWPRSRKRGCAPRWPCPRRRCEPCCAMRTCAWRRARASSPTRTAACSAATRCRTSSFRGDRGPVTVMILVHESVARPRHFDEQGYRGVILPVPGHGAMAVLTRGAGDDAAAVERTAKSCSPRSSGRRESRARPCRAGRPGAACSRRAPGDRLRT